MYLWQSLDLNPLRTSEQVVYNLLERTADWLEVERFESPSWWLMVYAEKQLVKIVFFINTVLLKIVPF